jgi:hypothetical protein
MGMRALVLGLPAVAAVDDSGEVRDAEVRLVDKPRAHVPQPVGLLLLR